MWRQNVQSLQCDAAHIPLANESVDLIVTSPPYFSLRDYQEDGQSLKGQVGNEATPWEFLDTLWRCTEEWMRVLKPRGSIFVNLGDKWAGGGGGPPGRNPKFGGDPFPVGRGTTVNAGATWGFRGKSLMNIPARYAIGCTDRLGLILREEIVWSKPNGLPESVKDRCRRSHELVFHLTKQGDYYSAVARIREEQQTLGKMHKGKSGGWHNAPEDLDRFDERALNPLGKLPSSVWEIPLAPLNVPKYLEEETLDGTSFDFDHFAAYPPELVRRIIDGWSPVHVCTRCGQGRFPVTAAEYTKLQATSNLGKMPGGRTSGDTEHGRLRPQEMQGRLARTEQIVGNACACTPYEDHPERRGKDWRGTDAGDRAVTGQRMGKEFQGNGHPSRSGGEWGPYEGMSREEWRSEPGRYGSMSSAEYRKRQRLEPGREDEVTGFPQDQYGRGPVREYLLDDWEPPPATLGVVLDPFGGTGTTAITAAKMGRLGITCDLSFDYAKHMVDWRMHDLSQNRRK